MEAESSGNASVVQRREDFDFIGESLHYKQR